MGRVKKGTVLDLIDQKTGEYDEDHEAVVRHKQDSARKQFSRAKLPRLHRLWGMVDFSRAAQLELSTTQWRIVFVIAKELDRDTGWAKITIAEIARAIGKSYNATHLATSALSEMGIVLRHGKKMSLSPALAFRGSVEDWEYATHRHIEDAARRGAQS